MRNILYYLGKIEDNRQKQGKRYALKSILALVLIGYMQGYTSLARIYRFGKTLTNTQKKQLGFISGKTPSHPTITETIKKINPKAFEEAISKIILAQMDPKFRQIAIDGKSIRSTNENLAGLLHLVSAYVPDAKAVISQIKSKVAGGEIKSAKNILSKINLKNKVVTGDAMFAQNSLCTQITKSSGNYLFKVKRNKKRIINDIDQEFHLYKNRNLPIRSFNDQVSKAHGRIDERRIEVISSIEKNFAGLNTIKQIARIQRKSYTIKTKKETIETHYIITSLPAEDASPAELLKFSVNHWAIENNLHRTRDVIFKEDTCNILSHISQQNNACLRNLAICLLNKINNSVTLALEIVLANINNAFKLLFRRI